jgi:hypothetical protein
MILHLLGGGSSLNAFPLNEMIKYLKEKVSFSEDGYVSTSRYPFNFIPYQRLLWIPVSHPAEASLALERSIT